jgi:hypothetical protein
MIQLVKEYKPDDTMAELEMEKALSKLSLGKKKEPKDLNDELSAIKCRYKLDLTKSKKKAQIFRIGGAQYASIISITQMIYRSKGGELTCEKLLEEMHNQWRIAGNKSQDKEDSDNEDEVAATATTKDSGKKKTYVNPDKETKCNHCKRKGHVENKCWEKNPDLIPDKLKGAEKKQVEKKAKKTASTVATAFEDEDKMVLTVLNLHKEIRKISCYNVNDASSMIPINKDIVYLNDFKESDDEESDYKESDDEESDDNEGCYGESDDKEGDSDDDNPLVTVLDDLTDVDLEVSNDDTYNLDLSLSAVANVIEDATFTTGAHILESQDIWIANTSATSHVTKHAEGRMKHCQTSV